VEETVPNVAGLIELESESPGDVDLHDARGQAIAECHHTMAHLRLLPMLPDSVTPAPSSDRHERLAPTGLVVQPRLFPCRSSGRPPHAVLRRSGRLGANVCALARWAPAGWQAGGPIAAVSI
jgi:hypothetical protein